MNLFEKGITISKQPNNQLIKIFNGSEERFLELINSSKLSSNKTIAIWLGIIFIVLSNILLLAIPNDIFNRI
jgi:hypothetical protein